MLTLLLAGLATAQEPAHGADPHATPAAAPAEGHAPEGHPAGEPASAAIPAGAHGEAPAAHGAEGEHAAAEHGAEGEHAAGGHHHVYYSDDDDLDSVPNWADPTKGSEPNTESYVLGGIGWHVANLLVLFGLMFWFGRRPVGDTFRDRALSIRKEITGAVQAKEDAEKRHHELVARLQKIEDEVRTLEQQAEGDAQREEAKLVERAQREAERIAEQAERNVRDETNRARQTLRNEAVELAVKLAEATLQQRVGAEDQQTLAREFLRSLKEADRV
jgi:F-type H+-transporting ATPase subunit b